MTIDIQAYFDNYLGAISLGKRQVRRIESASSTLMLYLQDRYQLTHSDVFLQGSYANGTAVKPVQGGEYDVDIVCVSADQADSATSALADMYKLLDDTGRYHGRLELKKPCVRIQYADDEIGKFHVDVVPVRVDQTHDIAPLDAPRRQSGWHPTAPNEYTEWCARQGPQFIRTVKMLKRWRDEHQGVRQAIKSIVLQVLVARHMPSRLMSDGECIYQVLHGIHQDLEPLAGPPAVLNPVLPDENLTKRWELDHFRNFQKELAEAVELAQEAIEASTLVEACEHWRELFGDSFPAVAPEGSFAVRLGDTSHAEPPEKRGWYESLDARYGVTLDAWEYRGKNDKNSPYCSGGQVLFAGKQLRFRANVHGPTAVDIWWRVTNTGNHASESDALRGAFFKAKRRGIAGRPSKDPAENWESTAYTGVHLVEVFLLVGERIVARSTPFRVNILGRQGRQWSGTG